MGTVKDGVASRMLPSASSPAQLAVEARSKYPSRGSWCPLRAGFDEVAVGGYVGRAVVNVLRLPTQVALVGRPLSHEPPDGLSQKILHFGALGLLREGIRCGAGAVGSAAGAWVGAMGFSGSAAQNVSSVLTHAMDIPLSLPVGCLMAVVRVAGRSAATIGSFLGVYIAFCVVGAGRLLGVRPPPPAYAGRVLAEPPGSWSSAPPTGAARVTQLSTLDLRGLIDDVSPHVAEILNKPLPDLTDVEFSLVTRRDVRASEFQGRSLFGAIAASAFVEDRAHRIAGMAERATAGSPASVRLASQNIIGATYDEVRAVLHHELTHIWQFAHYPNFFPHEDPGAEAARSRELWFEGHATANEEAAVSRHYVDAQPSCGDHWLSMLVDLNRQCDPDLARANHENEKLYEEGHQALAAIRSQSRFDSSWVEDLVFTYPSLAEVLFAEDPGLTVTLPDSLSVGDGRDVVTFLRHLNPYVDKSQDRMRIVYESAPLA